MTVTRHNYDGGCMGGDPYSRISVSITCSDGTVVYGYADTETEAREFASRRYEAHEAFLKLDPMGKLKVLVAGDLLDTDQRAAIRLIAQILEHNQGVINV